MGASGRGWIASPIVPRLFASLLLAALVAGCSGSSEPPELREGRAVYGEVCSVCHGARGEGQTAPALTEVITTWPSCADQVEWIALGSDGWKARHGDVYGARRTPVAGGMPAHQDRLTPAEIRLVAAFERTAYGGLDAEVALAECGAG